MGLPSWAKKKPVDGVLAIPSAVGANIKKKLGPLARPIVPSVRFVATEMAGTWGLSRQLRLASGGGAGIAKTLDVLAASELPLVNLDLQVSAGASNEIEHALEGPALSHLASLALGLAEPLVCAAVLGKAIAKMQKLQSLHIVAKGGTGAASVVEVAPQLSLLKLVSVGLTGADLKRLVKAQPAIETLQLLHVQASDDELRAVFNAWAKTLTSLSISRAEKVPADYAGLGELTALREVDLGFVTAKGLGAIAHLKHLVSLKLHGAKVTPEMASKWELAALEVLNVKWAEIDAKAIDVLVKAAPKLRLLEIPAGVKAQKSWVKKGRQIL